MAAASHGFDIKENRTSRSPLTGRLQAFACVYLCLPASTQQVGDF